MFFLGFGPLMWALDSVYWPFGPTTLYIVVGGYVAFVLDLNYFLLGIASIHMYPKDFVLKF